MRARCNGRTAAPMPDCARRGLTARLQKEKEELEDLSMELELADEEDKIQ